MTALLLLRFLLVSSLSQLWPGVLGDEAAVEVSLSVVVDDEGTRKDLFVAQGEEPEGPALLFCRDQVGGLSAAVLVECVAELSSQVTIERVRRALPTDAPLPALELQVKVDEERKSNKAATPDIINNRRRALFAVTAAKVTEHER